MKHVREMILDVLFPRHCVGCGREGTVFCSGCATSFEATRPRAACPFCGAEGSDRTCAACAPNHALDGCIALFPYADSRVRKVLTGWKYRGDPAYAAVIASWIVSHESSAFPPLFKGRLGGVALEGVPIVTPIPLHASRLRSRGFNQAEIISRTLATTCVLPHADLLVRARKTAPQANIPHAERRAAALAGAFFPLCRAETFFPLSPPDGEVSPPAKQGEMSGGAGQRGRVLLCDDVFTTGATMDAAARALKDAGFQEVWGFTVAKG